MMIKKIKRIISLKLKNFTFFKLLVLINLLIYHFDDREHKKSFGSLNPNIKFYIIRPNGETEGILSAYLNVLKLYNEKKAEGYEVLVDYERYKNQYSLGKITDTKNSWEYFFSQTSNFTLNEVYKSKNVYLSGWKTKNILKKEKSTNFREEIDFYNNLVYKIPYNSFLDDLANEYVKNNITKNTLGVFIRGTDYIALKPKNHYVQPTIDELIKKIQSYDKVDQIFLVTEDNNISEKLNRRLGIKIIRYSNGIDYNYKNPKYLSDEIDHDFKYNNTVNYLASVIVLSKCPRVVSSITNATFFLNCIRHLDKSYDYYFNLGKY